MKYKHLNKDERQTIHCLKNEGFDNCLIAKRLNRSESTISRELKRNSIQAFKSLPTQIKDCLPDKRSNSVDYTPFNNFGLGYRYTTANDISIARRTSINKNRTKIKSGSKLEQYILDKLNQDWSPEQIEGRMKSTVLKGCERTLVDSLESTVSHELIYQYIYSQEKSIKNKLSLKLRNHKGKYRRKRGTTTRAKEREELNKKRINLRPQVVLERSRIGDWEGDTIVGGERTKHILTHVDRKSGFLIANKLDLATAQQTLITTVNSLRELTVVDSTKNKKLYTITYDNGVQFSKYETLELKLGIEVYFAYPYHSWERGTNENTNGLLRQYFPKKTLFANITQEDIDQAVNKINNRPRKRLGYQTPYEVFYS